MVKEDIKKATVTFESEGHKVIMDLTVIGGNTKIKVTSENPDNLKEQKGIHVSLADIFFNALNEG